MTDKKAITDLEKKFWDTMVSKDAKTASAMMAEKSIVTGAQGVSEIKRGDFAKMMEGSKWSLESYKLSDIQVLLPTKDTAIIAYKVHQKGKMDGKPYDMECADTTTWTHDGNDWLCALYTETMLGKPDKKA